MHPKHEVIIEFRVSVAPLTSSEWPLLITLALQLLHLKRYRSVCAFPVPFSQKGPVPP